MEILLTRHGQTEWNFLQKVQGKADIKLNEKGIKQAKDVKDKLKNEQIDLILCSPLIRACLLYTSNVQKEFTQYLDKVSIENEPYKNIFLIQIYMG